MLANSCLLRKRGYNTTFLPRRHPSFCSLRLVAQDTALSRREQGFETPRERQINVRSVLRPPYLRGSGYAEGALFPWTMSDFSLMDAIECGIVKLPRVPVAENIPGNELPMFRNLWEHIRKDLPRKGRGSNQELDPLKAADALADGASGALWPL